MKKNQFKASSTLRLARTFLQKHKVMTTWRAKDTMNALEEVTDEAEDQEDVDQTKKAVVGNTATAKAKMNPIVLHQSNIKNDNILSQNKPQEAETFTSESAILKHQA